MPTIFPIPAAQYLRMSTDDQPNSIPIQREAIRRYAAKQGYRIIATYSDPGKSGVGINRRPGLRKLIRDVVDRNAAFKAILVYDVSRWGRFQDVDESGHYEFLCRSAGVAIHYCAEQFANDGAMPNTIMKVLKRTMAAEFSRELSVKVSAGQRRIAVQGFRLGSVAGYGLRRMLLSADGRKKRILHPYEWKNVRSDRITLVPGPRHEVECVRKIFSLCRRKSAAAIAAQLNRQGEKFTNGKPWTECNVYNILTNEKYRGVNIWGKTSQRFHKYSPKKPKDWIKTANAFTPLVSQLQFERAQEAMERRRSLPKKPDGHLLEQMKRVLAIEGRLSETLLKKHHVFNFYQYTKRLGSMRRAYELIGYRPPDRAFKALPARNKIKRLRSELLIKLKESCPSVLRVVRLPSQRQRQVIELDPYSHVAVHICLPRKPTVSGKPRWLLPYQSKEKGLPCLICIPDPTLRRLMSLYLVPAFDDIILTRKIIWEGHPWLRLGSRLDSIDQFYEVAWKLFRNPKPDTTTVGDVLFTSRTPTVTIAGKDYLLPTISGAMFKLLVKNQGVAVSRRRLAEEGLLASDQIESAYAYDPAGQFVKGHMGTLRKKLGPFAERIVTVNGKGYTYECNAA